MSSIIDRIKAQIPTVKVETEEIPKSANEGIELLQKTRIEKVIPQQVLLLTQRTSEDQAVVGSATGDNIILEGQFGKVFEITKITSFLSAGTAPVYKFEKHSGAGFATQLAISADDNNDKESELGLHLENGERIVLNVTVSGATAIIDVIVSYNVYIFTR